MKTLTEKKVYELGGDIAVYIGRDLCTGRDAFIRHMKSGERNVIKEILSDEDNIKLENGEIIFKDDRIITAYHHIQGGPFSKYNELVEEFNQGVID